MFKILFSFFSFLFSFKINMNPSIYAIISTFLSLIVFMTYYYYYQPEFVMAESENSTTMKFSLRLAIVYSLLFSSIIGLFVLCLAGFIKNYENNSELYRLDNNLYHIDRSFVLNKSNSSESSLLDSSSSESSLFESSSSESSKRLNK